MKIILVLAALTIPGLAYANASQDILLCRKENDSLKRLLCYDAIKPLIEKDAVLPDVNSIDQKPTVFMVSSTTRIREKSYDEQIYHRRIEVIPTFRNDGKKQIVALNHTLQIANAFGDLLINSMGKLDIKIAPGQTVNSPMVYFWEDNPFINDEPFDAMMGPVTEQTVKVTMDVVEVIYADGSRESFDY